MIPIKNERIRPAITKPVLSVAEAKQIILHTKQNRRSIWHYRDHAIIYLMITSGLRSFEIIKAKREDYQVFKGQPVLYLRKEEKETDAECVRLSPGACQALDDYLARRKDDNPYLFVTTKNTSPKGQLSRTFFQDMFKRVLKDCGLEKSGITPHCLRHTAATLNLLRGGSLDETRRLMRHASIQSTLVYSNHIARMKDDSENQIEKYILGEASTINEEDTFVLDIEPEI